jgi:hypothetical protein
MPGLIHAQTETRAQQGPVPLTLIAAQCSSRNPEVGTFLRRTVRPPERGTPPCPTRFVCPSCTS